MHETKELVINTGPLIALVAAFDNLQILKKLYRRVVVPYEVRQEILAAGKGGFAATQFSAAIASMRRKGIWIGEDLAKLVANEAGE